MSKYTLTIDNRETKLINLLKERDISNFDIKVEALKVGDVIISENLEGDIYKNTILIFERKTCSDLLSSINDGRYREQKARLLSNFSKDKICYIIENEISNSLNKYRKSGRQIVIGAIVNKCFRDKIKWIKTSNIEETLEFLSNICKKVVSNPEFFVETSQSIPIQNGNENVDHYSSNIKISKKDNITLERFGLLSLTIIPGVSSKIAGVIIEHYNSLPKLVMEINSLQSEEDKKIFLKNMSDIQIDISGGKKRRMGSKITERIFEFLKDNNIKN